MASYDETTPAEIEYLRAAAYDAEMEAGLMAQEEARQMAMEKRTWLEAHPGWAKDDELMVVYEVSARFNYAYPTGEWIVQGHTLFPRSYSTSANPIADRETAEHEAFIMMRSFGGTWRRDEMSDDFIKFTRMEA